MKSIKVKLAFAGLLILLGGILFVSVMTAIGWDFNRLETVKYESASYSPEGDFNGITVLLDNSDVTILPAEDGRLRVDVFERADERHKVSIKDGSLLIEGERQGGWLSFAEVSFRSASITVYLPKMDYDDFKLKTDTGDVTIKDISVNSFGITTDTGDVELVNSRAAEAAIVTDTGDVELKSLIASESLTVTTDTGDVELDGCDAEKIKITTDTGDVEGTLLTPKSFLVQSRTGETEYPRLECSSVCEVTTNTGDVKLKIKK